MSSGALILGHANNIFLKSINGQIKKGSNYSNKNINELDYIAKLKKTFREFNKFIFSNSGSEANIRALRIARSITNKEKFAMVNGSWHGAVDNMMFDFKNDKQININKIRSLSSGIDYAKRNVILLPYNNINLTKKVLDKNYSKISVIVIEPIQCGVPNKITKDYLLFLDKYCKKKKILLWFDEVITGLRVRKFAIYKKYKLKPDIVTFAKCFGGGMPIGITLYNSKIIKKKNKKIFFGGTFSGNPISTKVGNDTFNYIKKNKNKIDIHLNKLSRKLTDEINNFSELKSKEFRLQAYESIVRPIFTSKNITNKFYREIYDPNFKNSLKLKNYLIKNNIFISSNCCFFISFCHNLKDIELLIKKLKKFIIKYSS